MKKLIPFLTLILLLFSLGTVAHAAPSEYTLLAPLPTIESESPNLAQYIEGIYTLTIGLAGVLAVVMIVIGGIEYIFSAIPSAKSDAKNRITGALGGLLLALTAWILLNTINPALLQTNFGLENVGDGQEFNEVGGEAGPTGPEPRDTGTVFCNSDNECYDRNVETAEEAGIDCGVQTRGGSGSCSERRGTIEFAEEEWKTRDKLEDAGIDINRPRSCGSPEVNGLEHGCTNVYGFDDNGNGMADKIIDFYEACDCDLEITGGTEFGHQTHNDYRKVDFVEDGFLEDNNELSQFLVGKDKEDLEDEDSATKAGFVCTYEKGGDGNSTGDHWHCAG